ncbi:hypothetical protein GCM10023339_22520 [Alloalcanivorax gelatiniphagus]
MRLLPRVHVATLAGRWRTDRGLLLLVGLVVALTTGLTAAVAPLAERAADDAVAATVRDAGPRGAVVATVPEWYDDPRGKTRDPATAVQVRQDADYARAALPPRLAAVLRPGVSSVTTPALQLLDAGPGRFLQLAYVDTPDGAPAVDYVRGGPPRATGSTGDAGGAWSVQVAVSEPVAAALDLEVGARLPAEDEQGRSIVAEVSGVFSAADPAAEAWQVSTRLLQPVQGVSDGQPYASAAALVSAESLPDLRFGLPGDLLTRRVTFTPEPSLVRWRDAAPLEQSLVSLQAGAGLARGELVWDSLLGTLLADGRSEVASARGQAQVLVVGLLAGALLVLVLAAQLLVRRRREPLSLARQRGATLTYVAGELVVESLVVAVLGTLAGLGAVRLLVGSVAVGWAVPVLLVAAAAAPVLGTFTAGRATRRAPANRSARRTRTRLVQLQRLGVEGAVLAVAALAVVALRQRGVVGEFASGDLLAASAATGCAVAGAVVLVRVLPAALRWVLRLTRPSSSGVPFFVAARLVETGSRALPLLVTVVAVSQLTLGLALAATERQGQAAGARSTVGGEVRLDTEPDPALDEAARAVDDDPGVDVAAAGRVEDGVRVAAPGAAAVVRLVVVDAPAYGRLLAADDRADGARVARLDDAGGPVPALLRGGDPALADGLVLRWEDASVPLDVVGAAPDVGASVDPVVVVDAAALADAGVVAPPDTLWAVGRGAEDSVEALAARTDADSSVQRYADELERRHDAPLPAALLLLALTSASLLLAVAVLGAVLAAAAEAPSRGEWLGRLRALGIPARDLRRVLIGELVVPVAVAGLFGLVLGGVVAHAVLGSLSLELLTGQSGAPRIVVPWWTGLAVPVLLGGVLVVAQVEWGRARRRTLAQLLRG